MASTLPVQACVKSNASLVKLLAPPPFLLFLLLFLSVLSLLHIKELLTSSLSRPPPLLHSLLLFDNSLLLFDKQGLLSHLLHIQQHYLAFVLSPCPIFILANLIIFILFLSVYFSSSVSSSSGVLPEKLAYGDASILGHALPSQDDFFLASTPHQHMVLSQSPLEEFHVLCFDTNCEPTYCYRDVQSLNDDEPSKVWEKVKGTSIIPYTNTSHTNRQVLAPKELAKELGKVAIPEKVCPLRPVVTATPTVASMPADKVLNVDQVKVVQERGLQEKVSRSSEVTGYPSPAGVQVVLIDMVPAPANRRNCTSTRTTMDSSTQAAHPPFTPPASIAPPPAKAALLLPPTKSNMSIQRPPTSPRVKKSLQSSGSFARDGKLQEAARPILDGEKPSQLPRKPSHMVRSSSDQRLSQRDLGTEVATTSLSSTSSLSTNKPHMQRAQSMRSGRNSDMSATDTITSPSKKAPVMRRAQSLRDKGTPHIVPSSPSQVQVMRCPSFSASIDGLSDAEANKCFSDFITHRFALMKKEREWS